jgi:hypothetical protein
MEFEEFYNKVLAFIEQAFIEKPDRHNHMSIKIGHCAIFAEYSDKPNCVVDYTIKSIYEGISWGVWA